MSKNKNGLSRSKALAADMIFAAFKALKENDRSLSVKKVLEEVENRVKLDSWATERYQKSGYIRWQSLLHFFSIDCVKAGFIIKRKGYWFLTDEGEKSINLGKIELLNTIVNAYKEWREKTKKDDPVDIAVDTDDELIPDASSIVDQAVQTATDGIKDFISRMNPYEFQDIVAALLRAMGYYTPFVAPKGKDGGVDILAYRDPFGIESPRIKVQVKHRESSATVKEIRELIGTLQKAGDVGIFVSTGGFTPDAKSASLNAHVHVELINLEDFINLWQEFYKKLSDEDKNLMPLFPVYFLSPTE